MQVKFLTMELATRDILRRNLKLFRKKAGFTQRDVADRLNVSEQTVARWEIGTRVPSIEHLEKLAELYGVEVADFFKTVDEQEIALQRIINRLKKLSSDKKEKVYKLLEEQIDLVAT